MRREFRGGKAAGAAFYVPFATDNITTDTITTDNVTTDNVTLNGESSITVIDQRPASSLVTLMCRQSAGGAVLDPVKG